MNSDMISRTALINSINATRKMLNSGVPKRNLTAQDILDCIYGLRSDDQPLGKWEERADPEEPCAFFRRKFYCSVCGNWNSYGKPRFCMDCGAEMETES